MPIATRFATSPDGTCIAYDVCGGGPPLLLLHGGYIQDRRTWHDAGYVETLATDFRVITIDIRGHGESDAPTERAAYTMGKLVADVLAVADTCQAERFLAWGFSLGGTIALHLAARSPRPRGIVVAGSCFGKLLDGASVNRVIEKLETAALAKEQHRLSELRLPAAERWFAERANLRVVLGMTPAGLDWPPIEPPDLRCPAYLFAGAKNTIVSGALETRRAAIDSAGLRMQIFDGLDHMQEFSEGDVIFPAVRSFLDEMRAARQLRTPGV